MNTFRNSILMWLIIFSVPAAAAEEESANGSAAAANLGLPASARKVAPEQLQQLTRSGDYVHVPIDILHELLRRESRDSRTDQSPVEVADYSATLEGRTLVDGKVTLQLRAAANAALQSRSLGPSNLRDLALQTDEGPVVLAANPQGQIVPLSRINSKTVTGRWSAIGRTVNRRIEFDLTLPHATVTRIRLQTDTDTTLTSPNATVNAQKADDFILWTLFPESPAGLKISCEQRAVMTRSDVILSPRTEVRIAEHEARLIWQVPLPTALAATELHVQCNDMLTPSVVRLDTGLACRWQRGDDRVLRIAIPDFSVATTLRLEAPLPEQQPPKLNLPTLVPTAWSSSFGESGGLVENRFGGTTVLISPHLVVTRLNLNGLLERDVTFAPDGSQTLELEQFRKHARAVVHLAPATAVVADSLTVMKPDEDQPFLAVAYANVTVRAGELGRVEWEVPSGWRVTRVREAVSDAPLLFQMNADANDQTNRVAIDLRDPISAFTGDPSAALVLDLQSTERDGSETRRFPFLSNERYQQQFDLIAVQASDDASIQALTESGGVLFAPEDRDQQLSWLPAALLTQRTFVQRELVADLPAAGSPDPASGLYAAVDYNADVATDVLTETIRIRLRSAQPIPNRIPIRFPAGTDVQVSDESISQPSPIIRRPQQAESGRWIIELPGPSQQYTTFDFTLLARRPLTDRMPASIVQITGARMSGGTIQPPLSETISLRGTQRVADVEQYPARPAATDWTLVREQPEDAQQPIRATAFVRFEPVGADVVVHGLQRQSVPTDGGTLKIRMPATQQVHVLVDNQPVFAEQQDQQLQVPLPQNKVRAVVTLVWRTVQSATAATRVDLPQPGDLPTDATSLFLQVPQAMASQLSNQAIRYPQEAAAELFPEHIFGATEFADDATPATDDRPASIVLFESQWQQAFDRSAAVYFRSNADSPEPIRINITSEAWQQAGTIVLAVVVFLVCSLLIRSWPNGLTIAGLVVLTATLCSVLWPVAQGITIGALMYVVGAMFRRLRPRRRRATVPQSRQITIEGLSGLLIFLLTAASLQGQPPSPILIPELPEADSSFAFVDKTFLEELKNADQPGDTALVMESSVQVVLESEQSCLVTIQSDVACPADTSSRLSLPLENLVLIDAWIDGEKVFPARDGRSTASLTFEPDSIFTEGLSDTPDGPRQSPPSVVGRWNIRQLKYTVRHVPEPAPLAFHVNFPLPPAFRSTIEFQDQANLVSRISSARQETDFAVLGRQTLMLPPLFGDQHVDLAMTIDRPVAEDSDLKSMLVCLAEITPTKERFVCQYRIPPAVSRSTQARLKIPAGLRLIEVESEEGRTIPWSADGTGVVIEAEPDDDGYQRLTIEYRRDTATRLSHDIDINALRTVNGATAAAAYLLLKTSDAYFIRSVKGKNGELAESTVTPEVARFRNSRGIATMLELSSESDPVTVQIAEIQATQTVRLKQQAVVQERQLTWSCDCEIELAGQPIFRQWLRLSPDVTITDVAAVRDGASRLQSWTRHEDRIVVTLREATRGNLTLRIRGMLPRTIGEDLSLPVIQFPPTVQVTESKLTLSSESDVETYIKTSGSAVSAEGADVFQQPLTASALRLDIVDESIPVVLQGSPAKRVDAEAAVLLYEDSQELRCALLLSLAPPEAAFRLRFSCPPSEFGSRRPVFLSNREAGSVAGDGGEYVVDLKDQTSAEQILAFADIPVQSSESGLVCHLPLFRAGFNLTNIYSFDLRNGAATIEVPAWAARSAEFVGLTQVDARHTRIESQYNERQREVVLTPPATRQEAGTPENPVSSLLVEGRHLLRLAPDGRIVGTSGFLVFQSQPLPLTIELPESLTLAEVRVDGLTAATQPTPGGVTVKPDSAVAFVAVTWALPESPVGTLQPRPVDLPVIAASQSLVTAFVVPPQSRWLWHSVDGSLLSLETLVRGSRDSLRRGLGLIGLPAIDGSESEEFAAADLDQQRWTLLQQTNASGVAAAQAFFERCDSQATATIVDVSDADRVRISAFRYPAPRTSLSVAAGLFLVLTSSVLKRRQRRRSAAPDSEGTETTADTSADRPSTVV